MLRPILFASLVFLVGAAQSLAADESWVGQTVMPRRPDVKFRDQNPEANNRDVKMSEPMTRVLSDMEGSLVVYSPGTEAKVQKSDMVLLKDAEAYYTEYMRDRPASAWGFDRRGIARRMHGDFENAIKDFTESIRIEPTAAHYNNRGSTWSAKREFDKAIQDYDDAIRADDKFASAFTNRGIAWWSKQEPEKAMRDFDEAIRLDSKDVNALTNRGFALFLQKKYDKAIHDFDEAIKIDGKYAYAIGNKAEALVKVKKYPEAMQSFETAIQLTSVDWIYRDYAAFWATCPDARFRNGQKAVELAKKAIELAGNYADGRYQAVLAAAYAETGNFEQAVAAQQKALEDKSMVREDRSKMESRLELYRRQKPYRDGD